ncbi:hypothetical protein KW868_00625 [Acinetobacter guillouiae]|uniref:Uncharacterized protein n=1 Tax=Acinetobacter guillouiae TaxID=106649 RepID=A0A8X8GAM3_ACIGI|nr:hypothetical protein [Acinetobacter guillouiae]MCF0262979.1 hypothetical protein [Acinetobacter guillouiae]
MKELILNNLFGLVATIAVSFIVYVLQDRKARSADRERIKQTKKEIIDTIEAYIINNQDISESVFLNFKNGIERANEIIIEKEWDSIALLQDISYRLQSSRHLAVDQKLEYANKLDIMIHGWSSSKKLSSEANNQNESEIIDKILNIVNETKRPEATSLISNLLKSRHFYRAEYEYNKQLRSDFISRITSSVLLGLAITSLFTFIFKVYFDRADYENDGLTKLVLTTQSNLNYIYGLILVVIVGSLFIVIRNSYLSRKRINRILQNKSRI